MRTAINSPNVLVVENALIDDRFCNNIFVSGGDNYRFYAGAPLDLADGVRIGTLCLMGHEVRHFTQEEKLHELSIKAESANRAKSSFLANMNHELRIPLNGGTGLGLSICKSLINLMGGKIDCTSEVGIGSCFWFEADFELKKEIKIGDKIKEGFQGSNNLQKILIAEDNLTNQKVLKHLLVEFDL